MIVDDLEELLQQTMLASASVKGYVGTRIHPTEIALVRSQTFPCICFDFGTSSISRIGKNGIVPIQLWIHSTKDYAETFEIFELLFAMLHATRITDARIHAVGTISSGPTKYSDGEVYSLVSGWSFNCIEAGV